MAKVWKFIGDAGHGGAKPGAVFDPNVEIEGDEIEEEDINLEVMLLVAQKMRDRGHQFLLTRDRDIDIPLQKRKEMIVQFKPDAAISVHCNASESHKSNGIEAFYRDDRDKPLAVIVQQTLAAWTGLKDRGVFQDTGQLKKKLTFLDDSMDIAVTLLEIGFIDHAGDREYILNNITVIADGIVDALCTWAEKEGLV